MPPCPLPSFFDRNSASADWCIWSPPAFKVRACGKCRGGRMLEDKAHNLITELGGLLPLIVSNTLNALGAILILLVGLWLSGRADLLVVRMFRRTPHFDPMLQSFFGSLARYMVLTFTVLAVLSEFGIQTTSLVAILGAASLAVGLALQGTLSNLAAGVMLLIFRPFRIGHSVTVGGNTGTVRSLSLFWTEVVTDANTQVIIPNASFWGQPIRNMITYYRACADSADRRSGSRRLGLERRL